MEPHRSGDFDGRSVRLPRDGRVVIRNPDQAGGWRKGAAALAPIDEHVTVVSGTFHMGTGETVDESAAAMTAGAYGLMPKGVRHFAWASGETVVQIHGVGPFKTFFVEQPKK